MAILTNSVSRYDATKQVREDFADMIYNISPADTPFMNLAGRDTAKQTFTEWQTDTLDTAVSTNAQFEGDDTPAVDTFTATNRVGNYTQIARKVVAVTGTMEKVKSAGMKSELGYLMAKKSKSLKNDMEMQMLSDAVAVVGNNSTARKSAGLGSWIITNWYQVATGGSPAAPTMSSTNDGYPQTAAVDGTTAVAFTETHLKNEIATMIGQTSDVQGLFVLVGAHNKSVVSGFAGIATRTLQIPQGKQAQIIAAADVYVSDFGKLHIIYSRRQPDNRAYIIDPSFVAVSYLRPFMTIPLAKTGDNTKRLLQVEYCLKVKSEKAMGTVRGLTTT